MADPQPDTACSKCGNVEFSTSKFCGHCGAAMPSQAPASVAMPVVTAPPTAPASGPSVLNILTGLALASTGVLFLVGLAYALGDIGGPLLASSAQEDDAKDESAKEPDHRRLDGAHEVDRAADFSYVDTPPSCSEFNRLTDAVKDIGAEVDKELRSGTPISVADEEEMGEKVLKEVEKMLGGRLRSSGSVVDYLTAVAAPLVAQADRKDIRYRFYYGEGAKMENALALPGGYIIVTQPLLENWTKNEAQLAIVLGHEIGHIEMRHPVAVVQYARTLGLPEDEMFSAAALQLLKTPYNSRQEEDSDKYGAHIAHVADYSVFQGVALWEAKIGDSPGPKKKKNGGLLGVILDEAENLMGSHPPAARRACVMKQLAAKEQKKQSKPVVYVGQSNLKKRVAMTERVW